MKTRLTICRLYCEGSWWYVAKLFIMNYYNF